MIRALQTWINWFTLPWWNWLKQDMERQLAEHPSAKRITCYIDGYPVCGIVCDAHQ